MTPDELRICNALERWARTYDSAAERNPFGLHRVRAKALRKVAQAIKDGKHR